MQLKFVIATVLILVILMCYWRRRQCISAATAAVKDETQKIRIDEVIGDGEEQKSTTVETPDVNTGGEMKMPEQKPQQVDIQSDANMLLQIVRMMRQIQPRLSDISTVIEPESVQTDEMQTQQQVNINDLSPDDPDMQYKILFSWAELLRRRLKAAGDKGQVALDKAEELLKSEA
jgi:hypothetical protein